MPGRTQPRRVLADDESVLGDAMPQALLTGSSRPPGGEDCAPRRRMVLCRWAFDVGGLHRIESEHSAGNHASCRVAVKADLFVETRPPWC